jgi:hypothetical protein
MFKSNNTNQSTIDLFMGVPTYTQDNGYFSSWKVGFVTLAFPSSLSGMEPPTTKTLFLTAASLRA